MIHVKSPREIDCMRRAGSVAAAALAAAEKALAPGITTRELDRIVYETIKSRGAEPSFLGYDIGFGGFSGSACISVNEEVIHGVPGKRVIRPGDLVKVDVGAYLDGFHGDCARTFAVGETDAGALRLMNATRQSFYEGIKNAREGMRVSDISAAVQAYIEGEGYSIVRKYVGHGVGRDLHEDPEVPHFGRPGRGPRLIAGMTFAVEPMVNAGGFDVRVLPDRWTVVTADGSLSAHYENTVLITKGEPELLTLGEDG